MDTFACPSWSAPTLAGMPASSIIVATDLRNECDVTSGNPRSPRTFRHCLLKLSGSRHVPTDEGKIIRCSPQNGRVRRSVSAMIANSGSGTVRSEESVLPLSRRFRPSPWIRAILPDTVALKGTGARMMECPYSYQVVPPGGQAFGCAKSTADLVFEHRYRTFVPDSAMRTGLRRETAAPQWHRHSMCRLLQVHHTTSYRPAWVVVNRDRRGSRLVAPRPIRDQWVRGRQQSGSGTRRAIRPRRCSTSDHRQAS